MDGYKLYCMCRTLMGRNRPSYDSFQSSNEFGFYSLLSDHLSKSFDDKEIGIFLKANHVPNPDAFDPYKLMADECMTAYYEWKKKSSDKNIFFSEVVNGIAFIENFCIKNNITFEQYGYKYAAKHIREKKFDWTLAVYFKFIDITKLSRVEKMLLKTFISQYNIIERRLNNPELSNILDKRATEMKELLRYAIPKTTQQVQSNKVTK